MVRLAVATKELFWRHIVPVSTRPRCRAVPTASSSALKIKMTAAGDPSTLLTTERLRFMATTRKSVTEQEEGRFTFREYFFEVTMHPSLINLSHSEGDGCIQPEGASRGFYKRRSHASVQLVYSN
jgi:hypothetical protein